MVFIRVEANAKIFRHCERGMPLSFLCRKDSNSLFLRRLLVISCAILFSFSLAQAQQVVLNAGGNTAVENRLEYFKDENSRLSFEEVQQQSFKPLPTQGSPNFGFDRAAYWFRFDVTNQTVKPDWLMEVAFAPLDRIDIYLQRDSVQWDYWATGDTLSLDTRAFHHRHPLVNVKIAPGEVKRVYIRVQTISSVQVPVVLWQEDVFFRMNYHLQLLNGLFYGAMLMMAFYQLFLFFSTRDRVTAFYVVTLFSMVNVVSFYQGYHFLYLHPNHPEVNDWFAMFCGPFFITSSSLLTRSFLNLRIYSKWFDRLILTNMMADIVVAILMTIFYRQVSYGYHHFFVLAHCALVLSASAFCLYRKFMPSRFYLLAWVTPLLAAGSFTVSNLGLAPGYLGTNYTVLMLGCILQMIFIALALGDRLNRLVKENESVREQELIRQKTEKERLEEIVQQRTMEISQKSEKLEEVNRVKDKLFSVVSHDIRSPLASLQSALHLVKIKQMDSTEFTEIAAELTRQLDKTNEFTANLLNWAKLQMRGERYEPQPVNIAKLFSSVLDVARPIAREKNIQIERDIPEGLIAVGDENMVIAVIRNLVMNAIKFTPIGGKIALMAATQGQVITVSVTDNGVGIPAKNHDSLFTLESVTTLGTKQEKGTGLGLVLCKEYVEKNGGKIWVESEQGSGTTFYFTIKALAAAAD